MKISNKTFYKQHSIELERYLIGQKTLHVINESSKDKIVDDVSTKLYINPTSTEPLLTNNDELFDTIIFTDIIESGRDIYELLYSAKLKLKDNFFKE